MATKTKNEDDETLATLQRRIARATKIVDALDALDAQRADLSEQLAKVLKGEQAIGDLVKIAASTFSQAWERRYRSPYAFTAFKDVPHLKRLIKQLGIEELARRMQRYLLSHDLFFAKARHSFGVFVATVNQHAEASGDAALGDFLSDEPAPSDCRHTPPCATQAGCTKASNKERLSW